MSLVGTKNSCSFCLHKREKKDGWIPCCDAFPDGIPFDFEWDREEANFADCVPGIGFIANVEAQRECGYYKEFEDHILAKKG